MIDEREVGFDLDLMQLMLESKLSVVLAEKQLAECLLLVITLCQKKKEGKQHSLMSLVMSAMQHLIHAAML